MPRQSELRQSRNEGHFTVTLGGDGDYWVFKLIAPHTYYNRKPTVRRSFIDKFATRQETTHCAREHADMSLDGEWFAPSPKNPETQP